MALDLIFLPLLGGYLFFTHFHGTRYRASGFPAQRLIFPSATLGLMFLIAAKLIELMVDSSSERQAVWQHHTVRLMIPGLAVSAVLAALGFSASRAMASRFSVARLAASGSEAAKHWLRFWIPSRRVREWLDRAFREDGGDYFQPTHSVKARGFVIAFLTTVSLGLPVFLPDQPVRFSTFVMYVLSCCIAIFGLATFIKRRTRWPFWGLAYRVSLTLFFLAFGVAFASNGLGTAIRSGWAGFSPVSDSGLPCLAFLISLLSLMAANFVLEPKAASAFRAISGRVNYLGSFLFWSFVDRAAIEITLKSGKVYVGQVKSLMPSSEGADGFLILLPWHSGYRDEKQRMHLVTSYAEHFAAIRSMAGPRGLGNEDPLQLFYKILPTEDIAHCGRFDAAFYAQFLRNAAQSSAPTTGVASS